MSTLKTFSMAAIAGIMSIALNAAIVPQKALAWHPNGKITKFVKNESTKSASVDANTAETGVLAKPGDILTYTITIKNDATPADNKVNDLAFVQITDELPAEVQLESNPAQRTIKETLPGSIAPGASVTKQYRVKVVTTKDITFDNKACFEGDSLIKDKKQSGCDVAFTKVKVEKQPEQPKPEQPKPEQPKVETPKTPALPASLPSTGPEAALAGVFGLSALGYAGVQYRNSKRAVAQVFRKK